MSQPDLEVCIKRMLYHGLMWLYRNNLTGHSIRLDARSVTIPCISISMHDYTLVVILDWVKCCGQDCHKISYTQTHLLKWRNLQMFCFHFQTRINLTLQSLPWSRSYNLSYSGLFTIAKHMFYIGANTSEPLP